MTIEALIKKDNQIKKFSWYGFLKNLKFFEPYLLLYLLGDGMSLLSIGYLFAVREATTYIFEVPSGIIADYFGKKKELMMCFVFYIISFIGLFIGKSVFIYLLAMFFYGLGEAFRSGTHKAMILSYLEQKGWQNYKTKVYGRTRSFSLVGSSVSAMLAIVLALYLPSLKLIFLFSVIPFIIDFILIWSYPHSLDEATHKTMHLSDFFRSGRSTVKSILNQRNLRDVLINSAVFTGLFKTIKHYIQPILQGVILSTGIVFLMSQSADDTVKIVLGLVYGIFNLVSAYASKNLHKWVSDKEAQHRFDDLLSAMIIMLFVVALGLRLNSMVLVIGGFFFIYIIKDVRRPLFLVTASHFMKKKERATALSVESQISALSMIILGPLCGAIADYFGMTMLFVFLGIAMLVLKLGTKTNSQEN
ncbi:MULTISPECIES: MFS transporter [unclassified Fusibacter]|uniref:MFS transporter n=1 Tax=unclassified Fusibacter TaxID=2624464 RepID=UPI0013E96D82|nr:MULTISPECIES: MFS transporter [unclassified Fusibacter]MCK8060011.1 MFS transporter [Fusibacter sp. A2]NPE22151.1 MFS transporter [Fusibacter sp. A1]